MNDSNKNHSKQSGFTLIEILIVIGLIAILAAIVIIAINPARQFAQGRNSQRTSNVNAILNAVGQYGADNRGLFTCFTTAGLNSSAKIIKSSPSGSEIDIRSCIVPTYIPEIPVDPTNGVGCTDSACASGYNTHYTILQDSNGRIQVCAPLGLETSIPGSGPICVTR